LRYQISKKNIYILKQLFNIIIIYHEIYRNSIKNAFKKNNCFFVYYNNWWELNISNVLGPSCP
jgi:hypothetical protein